MWARTGRAVEWHANSDAVEAAARLPWRDALTGGGMPAHQYVVFATGDGKDLPPGMDRPEAQAAVEVLLAAIRDHPDAYDAYFRGYRWPMHYLELPDGLRYWHTAPNGTHMLNRCTLDSVEPPRRVDQAAQPIEWDGPPWAPFGSAWPPGYELVDGKWVYNEASDWRRQHRCAACGAKYMPVPDDRPCPRCGARQ
jgi:rubredoxin